MSFDINGNKAGADARRVLVSSAASKTGTFAVKKSLQFTAKTILGKTAKDRLKRIAIKKAWQKLMKKVATNVTLSTVSTFAQFIPYVGTLINVGVKIWTGSRIIKTFKMIIKFLWKVITGFFRIIGKIISGIAKSIFAVLGDGSVPQILVSTTPIVNDTEAVIDQMILEDAYDKAKKLADAGQLKLSDIISLRSGIIKTSMDTLYKLDEYQLKGAKMKADMNRTQARSRKVLVSLVSSLAGVFITALIDKLFGGKVDTRTWRATDENGRYDDGEMYESTYKASIVPRIRSRKSKSGALGTITEEEMNARPPESSTYKKGDRILKIVYNDSPGYFRTNSAISNYSFTYDDSTTEHKSDSENIRSLSNYYGKNSSFLKQYKIVSGVGHREQQAGSKNASGFHWGLDYSVPYGTALKAPISGYAFWSDSYGGGGRYLTIISDTGNIVVRMLHLRSMKSGMRIPPSHRARYSKLHGDDAARATIKNFKWAKEHPESAVHVNAGEIVAISGASGPKGEYSFAPHLHLEIGHMVTTPKGKRTMVMITPEGQILNDRDDTIDEASLTTTNNISFNVVKL